MGYPISHFGLSLRSESVLKRIYQFLVQIDLKRMSVRYDYGLDVRIDQLFWDFEFFSEDIELTVTSYETNECDFSIRNKVKSGQLCVWPQGDRCKI